MFKHAANPGQTLPNSLQEPVDRSLLGLRTSISALRPAHAVVKTPNMGTGSDEPLCLWVLTLGSLFKIRSRTSDSGMDCTVTNPRCYHMADPYCCISHCHIVQSLERKC